MKDIDRQIAGGIILTIVFFLLLCTSRLSGPILIIVLLAAIIGFVFLTTGINCTPADGILEMIPDGEYTFKSFYEETKNSQGEDILRENRSKVVQVCQKGEENFFGKGISWRVYRNNDPEKLLDDNGLTPGLVLRVRNNIIEELVLYTAPDD